ncbi:sugar transferase [Pseudooceanicola sp. LIPI14-2-Ac024]|uniref:sugar transferase n=1 Tax=Pseudooceanicola sp. LIPI14-2-Ac024 TaxID=3344875 RepID=UPI0035D02055
MSYDTAATVLDRPVRLDTPAEGFIPLGVPTKAPTPPRVSRAGASAGLFAADVLGLVVVGILTVALSDEASGAPGLPRLIFFTSLVALALRALAGLYPGQLLHAEELLRRGVLANAMAGIGTAVVALALFDNVEVGLPAAIWTLLACLLLPLFRGTTKRLLARFGLWSIRADIIAPVERREVLANYLRAHWQHGLAPAPSGAARSPVAVLARDELPSKEELKRLQMFYGEVILLADVPPQRASGLRPHGLGGEVGIRLVRPGTRQQLEWLKRATDLAIAIPAAILLLPIIAVAGGIIYLVDPGPVFYRQKREGRDGRIIDLLKLRTMYCDAEAMLQKLLEEDPAARREWSEHYKLRHDPRILPVIGNFLRVSSLDEMPQLVHVITGEMSLVGPRPFPYYHLDAMPADFREKRRSVTPGLTGLWQISSRSEADIEQQQQLDEFYIDNRCFWFDLVILIKTVPAVFFHKGAY